MRNTDFKGVPAHKIAIVELLREEGLDAHLERNGSCGFYYILIRHSNADKHTAIAFTDEPAILASPYVSITRTVTINPHDLADPHYIQKLARDICRNQ